MTTANRKGLIGLYNNRVDFILYIQYYISNKINNTKLYFYQNF